MTRIDKDVSVTKRPLRIACHGGPYTFMRIDTRVIPESFAVPEETGSARIVGDYILRGNEYVWTPRR